MSEPQMPRWQRWANFRFSVIGRLLSCPPQKGQLRNTIHQLAQKTINTPLTSVGKSELEHPASNVGITRPDQPKIRLPY